MHYQKIFLVGPYESNAEELFRVEKMSHLLSQQIVISSAHLAYMMIAPANHI